MEMALAETFVHIMWIKWKDAFHFTGNNDLLTGLLGLY